MTILLIILGTALFLSIMIFRGKSLWRKMVYSREELVSAIKNEWGTKNIYIRINRKII